jgi:hypothetical protein
MMRKAIAEIYRKHPGVHPPVGKGLHTPAFHAMAADLMESGTDRDIAYATAMKRLGRNRAVMPSHWRKPQGLSKR